MGVSWVAIRLLNFNFQFWLRSFVHCGKWRTFKKYLKGWKNVDTWGPQILLWLLFKCPVCAWRKCSVKGEPRVGGSYGTCPSEGSSPTVLCLFWVSCHRFRHLGNAWRTGRENAHEAQNRFITSSLFSFFPISPVSRTRLQMAKRHVPWLWVSVCPVYPPLEQTVATWTPWLPNNKEENKPFMLTFSIWQYELIQQVWGLLTL